MPDALTADKFCKQCGVAAVGKFCSGCGAMIGGDATPFIETIPIVGAPISFVRTWVKVLRAPVAEPVRLATSPAYKSHFSFLMIGIGILVAVTLVAAGAGQGGAPVTARDPAQQSFIETYELRLLIGYAIAAIITYALFRLVAPAPRSVETHAKLWSILVGFYLPLQIVLLGVVAFAGVMTGEAFPQLAPDVQQAAIAGGPWLLLAFNIVMVVNFAVAHARVWATPLWLSAAIFIACLAVQPYPLNAALYALGFVKGYLASL